MTMKLRQKAVGMYSPFYVQSSVLRVLATLTVSAKGSAHKASCLRRDCKTACSRMTPQYVCLLDLRGTDGGCL